MVPVVTVVVLFEEVVTGVAVVVAVVVVVTGVVVVGAVVIGVVVVSAIECNTNTFYCLAYGDQLCFSIQCT